MVFLAYYAAIGSLRTFLECFVLIHVQYTRQPGLGTELTQVGDLMVLEYGASLWVMVAGSSGSGRALMVLASPPGAGTRTTGSWWPWAPAPSPGSCGA